MLCRLHPGEDSGKLLEQYQLKKLSLIVTVIFIGTVSAAGIYLCSRMNGRLAEGARLIRNEWGAGDYTVMLQAGTDTGEEELSCLVEERKFTKEELAVLREEAVSKLPEIIKGENKDLQAVIEKLNLVQRIPGYPFSLTWRSGNERRVKTDGTVNCEDMGEAGEEIELTVILSCQEERSEYGFLVCLVPPKREEREYFLQSLKKALSESAEEAASRKEIRLPAAVNGEAVCWKEKRENKAPLAAVLTVLLVILSGYGMDRDLKKAEAKRAGQIEKSYGEFTGRLFLYMGAGLTVKNAFLKIAGGYQEKKKRTGKKSFLYEELLICVYQLSNGMPEGKAYEEWGNRCAGIKCRRLGFLLASHLRQGNEKIIEMLSEEMNQALEDRRSIAKKAGEEAGAKMLFPMMLMLLVVMGVILIPVFLDFSGMK